MTLSEANRGQIKVLQELLSLCDSRKLKLWLLGGWGVDALLGSISREHHDIDLIAELRSRHALRDAIRSIAESIPEDSRVKLRFTRSGIRVDIRFYYALPDGTLVSDLDPEDPCVYPWPPGSFPDDPNGRILDVPCRAMTWEAQYVAKQGYSHFDKGSRLRDKDEADLITIREHLPGDAAKELMRYFPGIPKGKREG